MSVDSSHRGINWNIIASIIFKCQNVMELHGRNCNRNVFCIPAWFIISFFFFFFEKPEVPVSNADG